MFTEHRDCECCERNLPAESVPFTSRWGVQYCIDCHDYGCDLVNACDWRRFEPETAAEYEAVVIQRKLRNKREPEGPTDEDMAMIYASFGVQPPV